MRWSVGQERPEEERALARQRRNRFEELGAANAMIGAAEKPHAEGLLRSVLSRVEVTPAP